MISCLRNVLGSGEFSRPTFKCLDEPSAMLGGSVLNAIGNFASGIITNNTNKKLTRETNAQNYQIWQESKEFNEMMQDKQNQYNSANAQVSRYREAGINPYLAMYGNGGNAGIQNAAVTAPDAPQMQAPHVQNPYPAQDIQNMLSNTLLAEQVQGQKIQNQQEQTNLEFQRQRLVDEATKRGKELEQLGISIDQAREALAMYIKMEPYQESNILYQNRVLDRTVKQVEADTLQKATQGLLNFVETRLRKELQPYVKNKMQAEIYETYQRAYMEISQGNLNNRLARGVYLDNFMKGIDAALYPITKNMDMDAKEKALDFADQQMQLYVFQALLPFVSAMASAGVGAGASIYGANQISKGMANKPAPAPIPRVAAKRSRTTRGNGGTYREEYYEYTK